MNITAKRYNLLRLWLEGFVVTNKCAGQLIKAALCIALLVGSIIAVLVLGFGKETVLAATRAESFVTAIVTGTFLPFIIMTILNTLLYAFSCTVILQILAAHALQRKQPLMEIFSGSVWPTIFLIIASILLNIVAAGFTSLMFFLCRSWQLSLIVLIACIFLIIRFWYIGPAIAVDNKGPIEAFTHSWDLTRGMDYIDALLGGLIFVVSVFLPFIVLAAIGYGLYIAIPLYFPDIVNMSIPPFFGLLIGFVLLILCFFYYVACWAFPVLMYLNRNAMLNKPVQEENQDSIFIPLPELENPATPIEGLGEVSAQNAQSAAPAQQQPQPTTNPDEHPTMQTLQMESIGVTRESVNISEKDADKLSQHLDQVHTPQTENLIQQADEDRMPTIVFDDEFAKQLEDSITNSPKPSDTKNIPPEDGPVKLSK